MGSETEFLRIEFDWKKGYWRMRQPNREQRSLFGSGLLKAWAAVAALLVLLAPRAGEASAVVPLTIEEMVAVADEVVHIKVNDSEAEWYNGKIITRNTCSIEDVLVSKKTKRSVGGSMEVVIPGGKKGKLAAVVPGMPTLKSGEEAILFMDYPLERLKDRAKRSGATVQIDEESPLVNSPRIIGGFQGKFKVIRESDEVMINGERSVVEDATVHRAVPGRHSRAGKGPSLDAFKQQIRNAVSGKASKNTSLRSIPSVGVVPVPELAEESAALRFFEASRRR